MFQEGYRTNNGLISELFSSIFERNATAKRKRPLYENDVDRALATANRNVRRHVCDFDFSKLTNSELRKKCAEFNIEPKEFIEKKEFIYALQEKTRDSCPICLEDFCNGETYCVTSCGHLYHTNCVDQHVASSVKRKKGEFPTCAMCKNQLDTECL